MNICGVSEKGETSRAGGGEGRGLNVPPPPPVRREIDAHGNLAK